MVIKNGVRYRLTRHSGGLTWQVKSIEAHYGEGIWQSQVVTQCDQDKIIKYIPLVLFESYFDQGKMEILNE